MHSLDFAGRLGAREGPGDGGWRPRWTSNTKHTRCAATTSSDGDGSGFQPCPASVPSTSALTGYASILSPSNASNDTVKKLRVLHRRGVPHYWLLDPEAGTLRVLRWTPDGYLEALSAAADETVRAEPFDAIEISLAVILDRPGS